MTTRTRWIIGLLLALVIGLAVGLVIVAGDDGEESTVTVSGPIDTPRSETTTVRSTPSQTVPPESGGVPSPTPGSGSGSPAPDGSGGLGE
jgi:hypothetical protein